MCDIDNGIMNRIIGKKIFHPSLISISYRNRGSVPRIHNISMVIRIKDNKDNWYVIIPMKRIIVIILRIIMFRYSARKIKANHPPIYSTLNPETNSDSPSAKSNGLRFVSARHLIIQRINKDRFPKIKGKNSCANITL